MSDFVNDFWSWYVAGISLVSILACAVLLWVSGKAKVNPCDNNTTGHVWDGDLREMNNPLPKWWVGLFIITVIFALAYAYLYPTLGAYPGKLGWSSQGQHAAEVKKFDEATGALYAKFQGSDVPTLAGDAQAMAIGQRLFLNNCAQCHGSDARGNTGFPNLSDKDWLWGGEPEQIKETIVNGRQGMMPPMAAAVGNAQDVNNLANYVLSLSGSPHDNIKAAAGKAKFAACAACHGMDGKGSTAMGAPNLTDDVWLHGWGIDAITQRINEGKHNVMPAQKDRLTEAQIQVVAAYVWGLSNKPKAE